MILDSLEDQLEKINLQDLPMRKSVWQQKIDRIRFQRLPRTLIAVCGMTGAGKSSLLNAVLEDSLIPTSGISACTSVVTEIQYHDKESIIGEVEFLTMAEWRAELVNLLREIDEIDKNQEDGDTVARAAWHKIHTLYPHLKLADVVGLGVDALLSLEQHGTISSLLGSTRIVESSNSEIFRAEISKYIGSSRSQNLRKVGGSMVGGPQSESQGAIWPLVRLVRIKTMAPVLSSGAVLVDLPGVADANLARGNIAKNYMRMCDYIWIVSEITRATDEEPAQNGNYNSQSITFIATKTDNVSCSEVIRELYLEDDPELQDIEARIDSARAQGDHWKSIRYKKEQEIHNTRARMNAPGTIPFARSIGSKPTEQSNKRKREAELGVHNDKRLRAQPFNAGAALALATDCQPKVTFGSDMSVSSIDESHFTGGSATVPSEDDQSGISRFKLQRIDEASVEAELNILTYKKEVTRLEKERKVLCALKRNACSKEKLREGFRNGLKQFESDEKREDDTGNSDPERERQDYDSIVLPVFTCSAGDYIQITQRLDNYSETTCFNNPADTEIPALQVQCRSLATKAREHGVSSLMNDLVSLLEDIETFLREVPRINISDYHSVSEKWSSETVDRQNVIKLKSIQAQPYFQPPESHSAETRRTRSGRRFNRMHTTLLEDTFEERIEQARIRDQSQRAIQQNRTDKGISHLLQKVGAHCRSYMGHIGSLLFLHRNYILMRQNVRDIFKAYFAKKIRTPCQAGAMAAKHAALKTVDATFGKRHGNTIRAIIRYYGEFKEIDLNAQMCRPMTRLITHPWSLTFDQNSSTLLREMAASSRSDILRLLEEVESSAPPSLEDRFESQCRLAYLEADKAIENIVGNIAALIQKEQKIISRTLIPYIKAELHDAYTEAMKESWTGAGSSERTKEKLHHLIDKHRSHLFLDACDNMTRRLDRLAEGVGLILRVALSDLSDGVEVNVATVWDVPKSGSDTSCDNQIWKKELAVRRDVGTQVGSMLSQLGALIQASRARATQACAEADLHLIQSSN
ncbi:unnamed protein product [Rhizoctonia solani]|uniref:Dynamin N-terminal domain-containing protein n=1 Tax=Rhizoctonia solani TaxID=456999 RepID=A0A8H3GSA9_9AGAM|nr:unnamed protein product [Rhizoctonia solani]